MVNGNGRGGENRPRKNWRHGKGRDGGDKKPRWEKNKNAFYNRPKWTPAKLLTDPIPSPRCPHCQKPIKDLASAFTDKVTGEAMHFDCARERIAAQEKLEKGDTVTYIGGGRFGIVRFENPSQMRSFKIKKIIEWEIGEKHPLWRGKIADHYSLT
jgi:hypothetical protein